MIGSYCETSCGGGLFVHVLGAMVLFGGTISAAALAWWTGKRPAVLARAPFLVLVACVLPAWVVMRAGAAWVQSAEDISGAPAWMSVGLVVAEPGLALLLVATGLAYWAGRRGGRGWQPRAVAVLTSVYSLALAVAWWAMSAKP